MDGPENIRDYLYGTGAGGASEALMPDQRSLTEQMVDVWRYARDRKMYDAQDFIAASWQGRDLNPSADVLSRPSCTTMSHEGTPADHLGIYDDGEEHEVDVPYCATCAVVMADEYRITHTFGKADEGAS